MAGYKEGNGSKVMATGNGDKGGGQATATATKRAIVTGMTVTGDKEGKGNSNKGGG
jgi:hypothetical protein